MALKEFKGRMLPSAPSSTLTVTSSALLWCGSFSCNTVRILVLPSGSVLLLMLATDFDLEIVGKWFALRIQYCLGLHGGLLSGLSVVCGGLHYLYGGYLNGLERRLTLWYVHFWSPGCFLTWTVDVCLCPYVLWMCCGTICALLPTVLDLHWVLKWFLFPHLWHFLPHTGHSLGGWDVPHLPHILPLTSGPGSSPRSLAFSCEGSDLIDCGRCCNSSVGLVSVKVLDGCLMLLCMLQ